MYFMTIPYILSPVLWYNSGNKLYLYYEPIRGQFLRIQIHRDLALRCRERIYLDPVYHPQLQLSGFSRPEDNELFGHQAHRLAADNMQAKWIYIRTVDMEVENASLSRYFQRQ